MRPRIHFGHQTKCDARAQLQPGHERNAKTISTPPTIPDQRQPQRGPRWPALVRRQLISMRGEPGLPSSVAAVIRRTPNERRGRFRHGGRAVAPKQNRHRRAPSRAICACVRASTIQMHRSRSRTATWRRAGKVDAAKQFSVFDLQKAAEFAEKKNKAGFNIYVGAALRQGETATRRTAGKPGQLPDDFPLMGRRSTSREMTSASMPS